MLYINIPKDFKGFTLIELLVVIAIIGTLAGVVLMALDEAREKGRDGGRKSQTQEILKALELYYTDNGVYPSIPGNEGFIDNIDVVFYGTDTYLTKLPEEGDSRYYYCASPDRKSVIVALDTENDKGGSNFCHVFRGTGPNYGCNAWRDANATDLCLNRF